MCILHKYTTLYQEFIIYCTFQLNACTQITCLLYNVFITRDTWNACKVPHALYSSRIWPSLPELKHTCLCSLNNDCISANLIFTLKIYFLFALCLCSLHLPLMLQQHLAQHLQQTQQQNQQQPHQALLLHLVHLQLLLQIHVIKPVSLQDNWTGKAVLVAVLHAPIQLCAFKLDESCLRWSLWSPQYTCSCKLMLRATWCSICSK